MGRKKVTVELDEQTHGLVVSAARVLSCSASEAAGILVREALRVFEFSTWPQLRRALEQAEKARARAERERDKLIARRQKFGSALLELNDAERMFRLGRPNGQRRYAEAIKRMLRLARK